VDHTIKHLRGFLKIACHRPSSAIIGDHRPKVGVFP
jgi:hypothetical protein